MMLLDRPSTHPPPMEQPAMPTSAPRHEPGTGPSWVGIGAQRSGTTWFTRLATLHPAVTLARGGLKELHFFDRFLTDELTAEEAARYRSLFGPHGSGEFTPAYLRLPWTPHLLAAACDRPPLVVALVRDPVTRLESAIRHRLRSDRIDEYATTLERRVLPLAWWESALTGSAYGSQLAAWRDVFGAESMLVLQYEWVADHPREALELFWRRLGFGPVPLREVSRPSRTASFDEWTLPAAWQAHVVRHLRDDVERTLVDWDLDAGRWDRWRTAAASVPAP